MSTKPSVLSPWATSDLNNGPGSSPNKVQPSSAKQTDGWDFGEIIPRNWWNYQLNNTYEWLLYLKELHENTLVGAENFGYDADASTGLTFVVKTDDYQLGTTWVNPSNATEGTALADDSVNYVYFDVDAGTLNDTTALTSLNPAKDLLLYQVTTVAGAITEVKDLRNMASISASLRDNNNRAYVLEDDSDNAQFVFERAGDHTKSIGFSLNDVAGTQFGRLVADSLAYMSINLSTQEMTISQPLNLTNTVAFTNTPTLPANNTFTENFEFDGTVQMDGVVDINNTTTIDGATTITGTFTQNTGTFDFNGNGQFDGTVDFNNTVTFNGTVNLNSSINPNDLTNYTAGNYVEVEQGKGFSANQAPTDEMRFLTPRGGTVRCRVTITITEDGTGGPVTCNVQRKKNTVDEGAVVTLTHSSGTNSLTHDLDITVSDNDTIEIEVETTGIASSDNVQVDVKLAVGNPSTLSYDMTL